MKAGEHICSRAAEFGFFKEPGESLQNFGRKLFNGLCHTHFDHALELLLMCHGASLEDIDGSWPIFLWEGGISEEKIQIFVENFRRPFQQVAAEAPLLLSLAA
ncbi:MAG: hypothetical protein M1383_00915 [Patescibacteria group bacterium]|nr:hypothetical protein [Patescibacteria group bacterium]